MPANLNGPSVAAASGTTRQLVVLCHGYGSDGNDLIGLAPYWQRLLPDAAFVAPNAPEPCPANPMGYQWFPIGRLDPDEILRGVEAAAPVLDRFIDAQLGLHGLDDAHLALVGFSQGTMMALHVGCAAPVRRPASAIRAPLPGRIASGRDPGPPAGADGPRRQRRHAAGRPDASGRAGPWEPAGGAMACFGRAGHSIDETGLMLGGRFIADAFTGRHGAAAAR